MLFVLFLPSFFNLCFMEKLSRPLLKATLLRDQIKDSPQKAFLLIH